MLGMHRIRRTFAGLVAIAALALGGSAIAGAATSSSSGSGTTTTTTPGTAAPAHPPAGRHVGANGQREQSLGTDAAAQVTAAAQKAVPGGTVLRVETDVDTGSPYEAHVSKADGSQVVVYVDNAYKVTSVAAFGGPGGGGPGGPPAGQTGA